MRFIRFDKLNCEGCPARELLNVARSRRIEAIRLRALRRLHGNPTILILCESAATDRFVYDRTSNYDHHGLRFHLRKELIGDGTDDDLLRFLNERRVWIVDIAICPLLKGRKLANKQRREAATLCLARHTRAYMDSFPSAKLLTMFPEHCGFLKRKLPDITSRVSESFGFIAAGLKEALDFRTRSENHSNPSLNNSL